ncbi:hypothetical protein DdX_17903 [Ditylenchus destructor]|uniref:Uncharacterized protein n=1 Tax=Ditylenchus destructor TaxID=166010 RepID=A0AAD4MM67_9BILA|nr:hypothetical protein DdX_17903 [Ditylenchus destructor]
MRSMGFSGLIVLCLIGFIEGPPTQTNAILSPYKPPAPGKLMIHSTADSQALDLQTEIENGTLNEDIAKILETFAKNNLQNIGKILVKIIGDFLRKNPKTQHFADIAEMAADVVVNHLADHISKRVYEVTKDMRPEDLKNVGKGDLKKIVIGAILSSKEPFKVAIARAIEKKAEELKKKAAKWNEILGDISQDKIAKIPGVDKELSAAIRKLIESAGDNLANEAYQKIKSPGKDKIIGKFVDHAYNGAAALAKASGEKFGAIARAVADLQDTLVKDFRSELESDFTQNPFL